MGFPAHLPKTTIYFYINIQFYKVMTGQHNKDELKQHSVFVSTENWSLLKSWCGFKGINITEKGGEIIAAFVKTVVLPDLKSRNLLK